MRETFRRPGICGEVAFLTMAQLLPVVGTAILIGLLLDRVEATVRLPGTAPAPLTPSRLGLYLRRGFGPTIVLLTVLIVTIAVVVGVSIWFSFQLFDGVSLTADQFPQYVILFGATIVGAVSLGWAVACLGVLPWSLATGLARGGRPLRGLVDAVRLLRRLGVEWFLIAVLWTAATVAAMTFGLLIFGLGSLVAATVATLVAVPVLADLYVLYLRRGGRPLGLIEPSSADWQHWQTAPASAEER